MWGFRGTASAGRLKSSLLRVATVAMFHRQQTCPGKILHRHPAAAAVLQQVLQPAALWAMAIQTMEQVLLTCCYVLSGTGVRWSLDPELPPTFAEFVVSRPLARHPRRQGRAQNLKQGGVGVLGAPANKLLPTPAEGALQNQVFNGLQLLPGYPGRGLRALRHHQARMETFAHGHPHQVTSLNGCSGVVGVGEQQGSLTNLHQHVQQERRSRRQKCSCRDVRSCLA